MVIVMKNNKMVLPVIIILLIIFLPLTVIGSYKSLSKGTSLENPSKEHKYNNKLFYYDSEGKLLGTYECTSSDCDDAQTEIDDEINDFYKEGDKNDIGVFNTDNVFIKDNDKIYLYSLGTKIKLLTLNMLKNYNSDIEGNYLIVKNEENLYGLFDLNVGNFKIKPSYDYMALANKTDGEVIKSDKIIVEKLNGYYLIDKDDNSLTSTFGVPIYDYNDNLIISKNNDIYSFYTYNGDNILSDLSINNYEYFNDYIIILTSSSNEIIIYNSKSSTIEKRYTPIETDSLSYEINDNQIIIKNNGNEFDKFEEKGN